ncbi:hypothetical protein GGR58DRAFT_307734 [Xylaria digitata]|nr:hypothetical protein GGR58DRAFT_307734 [Xylaria digitata]
MTATFFFPLPPVVAAFCFFLVAGSGSTAPFVKIFARKGCRWARQMRGQKDGGMSRHYTGSRYSNNIYSTWTEPGYCLESQGCLF